jgi:hypothetical protein
MFRLNRAMVDVHRMHRDGRLMQQVSTRREQNLQHVPQKQRAGTFQSNDKRPGAVRKYRAGGLGERPAGSRKLNRIRGTDGTTRPKNIFEKTARDLVATARDLRPNAPN